MKLEYEDWQSNDAKNGACYTLLISAAFFGVLGQYLMAWIFAGMGIPASSLALIVLAWVMLAAFVVCAVGWMVLIQGIDSSRPFLLIGAVWHNVNRTWRKR